MIRGPASAVWGANAMTGVVNVITKTPREMQGTSLSIRFGQFDRSQSGRCVRRRRDLCNQRHACGGDRATGSPTRFPRVVLTQEPFLRPTGTVPGTSDCLSRRSRTGEPCSQSSMREWTTTSRTDARRSFSPAEFPEPRASFTPALGPLDVQRGSTFKYGRMTYTRDRLKLQVFVNALDGESPALSATRTLRAAARLQIREPGVRRRGLGPAPARARHLLSYGGNYRHNNFDLSFARAARSRDEGGAYVQDQIFLSERFGGSWARGSIDSTCSARRCSRLARAFCS